MTEKYSHFLTISFLREPLGISIITAWKKMHFPKKSASPKKLEVALFFLLLLKVQSIIHGHWLRSREREKNLQDLSEGKTISPRAFFRFFPPETPCVFVA